MLRPIQWVILVLGLAVLVLGFAFARSQRSQPLPVYGTVAAFSLTNQLGVPLALEDLRGKIWVGNMIFSRCAGPCPRLSERFRELNAALADQSDLAFVSLTADPAFDSPEVLARYGKRFGAEPGRWWFLTGPKADLYRLAQDGLKLAVLEKDPSEQEDVNDLFIHSTILTLVDQQGQLRGFFEGLAPETPKRLKEAVRQLAGEGQP